MVIGSGGSGDGGCFDEVGFERQVGGSEHRRQA